MRAVIYCRVSSAEQTKNLSLPTQEKACREYCARSGYMVDRVFVDAGESAKTADRKAFTELLAYCRSKKGSIHAVVVYSLTRFSRNSADHHAIANLLRGFGITLRSVTEPIDESPSGRLMEGILAAMAQFDNEQRAERVVAGMKAAIDRGRWQWRAPIGYRRGPAMSQGGPSLVPDPATAPLVRHVFERFLEGISGAALARHAAGIGLKQPSGRPLHKSQIHWMLTNPIYVGRLKATGFGIGRDGDWEPIVSEELFTRVQQRIQNPERAIAAKTRHTVHPDFPLRRFVSCAVCHKPLTGGWSRGNGGRYGWYNCDRGCTRIRKEKLENAFLKMLDSLRPQPERWKLFRAVVLDVWRETQHTAQDRGTTTRRRISDLERKLALLDDAFIYREAIDKETYTRQRDQLREEIALARLQHSELEAEAINIEGLLAFTEHVMTHASALWTAASSTTERIQVQWALFPDGLRWEKTKFSNHGKSFSFFDLRGPETPSVRFGGPTRTRTWNEPVMSRRL